MGYHKKAGRRPGWNKKPHPSIKEYEAAFGKEIDEYLMRVNGKPFKKQEDEQ